MAASLLTRSLLRSTTLSSASGKEGLGSFLPSLRLVAERVDQRSVVGVSGYTSDISANA
jgi:hypothetical protein